MSQQQSSQQTKPTPDLARQTASAACAAAKNSEALLVLLEPTEDDGPMAQMLDLLEQIDARVARIEQKLTAPSGR